MFLTCCGALILSRCRQRTASIGQRLVQGVFSDSILTCVCVELPCFALQFKRIDDIESVPAGTMLDVLGVLHSIGDFTTITLKNGTEQSKRSIVLRDNSNRSIELTMWAEFASEPGDQLAQVRLVQQMLCPDSCFLCCVCAFIIVDPSGCLRMFGVWLSHVAAAAQSSTKRHEPARHWMTCFAKLQIVCVVGCNSVLVCAVGRLSLPRASTATCCRPMRQCVLHC